MAIRYEPLPLIAPFKPNSLEPHLTARQSRAYGCSAHQSSSQLSEVKPIMYTDSRMRAVLPIAPLVPLIAPSQSMLSCLPLAPDSAPHMAPPSMQPPSAPEQRIPASLHPVLRPAHDAQELSYRLGYSHTARHEVQLGRCSRSFSRAILGFSYGATWQPSS